MSDNPCEKQRKFKYRDHDFAIADLSDNDAMTIRDCAIANLVHTRENDSVKSVVEAFMGLLTKRGFRIIKKESA